MSAAEPNTHETRDRILDAARALFHRDGYAAVGINAICERAGVVKGSFYHFFPSKRDLLEAVIARNQEAVTAGIEAAGRDAPDGRRRVMAQIEAVLEQAASQQQSEGRILGCSLGTLAGAVPADHPEAARSARKALLAWHRLLGRDIRAGIDDGSIAASVDPDATAATLLAVIQGMSTLGRCFDETKPMREIARNTVKRLLPVGPAAGATD